MAKHTFTLAEVVKRLQAVVNRFPTDHVARKPDGGQGCIYAVVENGVLTPVCIIGQFFADLGVLGVLVKEIPSFDGEPDQWEACNTDQGIWNDLAAAGYHFDTDTQLFMRSVQSQQDEGQTWPRALQGAVDKYVSDQAEQAAYLARTKAQQNLGLH